MQQPVETAIHRRVNDARAGNDDSVLARCVSGWAVFGRQQVTEGYLLLLPDPVVPDLNALGAEHRARFLLDMSLLGDALLRTLNPLRINYAIYGNLEPALHAHIIPRYSHEPDALRIQQPWAYDWSKAPVFDAAAVAPLKAKLLAELAKLGALRSP